MRRLGGSGARGCADSASGGFDRSAEGAAAAAELGDDRLPAPDRDVVDPRPLAADALDGGRGEYVAEAARLQEVDLEPGRHGHLAVGVAGQRERAVGEGGDEAAVAQRVA